MELRNFLEAIDYRITEGSDYCWQCYGKDAYTLDSWDQEQDGVSATVIFDKKTQLVYEVTVADFKKNKTYRWINSDYVAAYMSEAFERNVNPANAWDDVDYCDVELEEDILNKVQAIMHYQEYDARIEVPLVVEQETLTELMLQAHKRDITLNQLIELIILEEINKRKCLSC